jgi:23S rRNA (guanine745-N1)-methyltransferase
MNNSSPLICPVCGEPLSLKSRTYRCANNHSFDLAKEGYVNLLLSHQRKSKNPGDDKAMIQARRRFFDSGAFDPLSDLIQRSTTCPPKPLAKDGSHLPHPTILDCGCGEGHFLGALSEDSSTRLRLGSPLRSPSFGGQAAGLSRHSLLTSAEGVAPPANSERIGRASLSALAEQAPSLPRSAWRASQFFGVDISKEAIRCAAKRYKGATWIVANGMRELPFADDSMDVILSVLAPRNTEEFARILKADGQLILGVPGPNHLIELRTLLNANAGDFEEKADEAIAKCAPQFAETNRELLSYSQLLNCEQIADLIQMTPIFWTSATEAKKGVLELTEIEVTISFALLTLGSL